MMYLVITVDILINKTGNLEGITEDLKVWQNGIVDVVIRQ